jgi:hypothetical protein
MVEVEAPLEAGRPVRHRPVPVVGEPLLKSYVSEGLRRDEALRKRGVSKELLDEAVRDLAA